MNRLQKKCLIASGGFHGLLLLILLFGSALMPDDRPSPATRITFFDPGKVTDDLTHGGSPEANAVPVPPTPIAPPQPPVNAPVVPPQPQPQVQPQPQPVRREVPQPAPIPAKDPEFTPVKPKTPQTDEFTPVDHPPVKRVASNTAAADARAKAIADNQRRLANQLNKTISQLGSSLSKATVISTSSGDDGGEAAVNYGDLVRSMYDAAWNRPVSANNSATVVVSVTIARNGHVTRHEITTPSGDSVLDRSILNALENVTDIQPFPAGSKDDERTYSIKFNLSAK
jgi:TonB family protein